MENIKFKNKNEQTSALSESNRQKRILAFEALSANYLGWGIGVGETFLFFNGNPISGVYVEPNTVVNIGTKDGGKTGIFEFKNSKTGKIEHLESDGYKFSFNE